MAKNAITIQTTKQIPRVIGKHVYANMYGIDEKLIGDLDRLTRIVIKSAQVGNMHILELMTRKFNSYNGIDGGVSVIALIEESHIALHDTEETVRKKVNKMFTGQQATAELQRKHGGDPEKCVVCQNYKYMFEPDDKKLEAIFDAERNGTMLAGEHKADLAKRINAFLEQHRRNREMIKGRLDDFMVRD